MINAEEAKFPEAAAKSGRNYAESDTLSENAMSWALHNAESRTGTPHPPLCPVWARLASQ